MEYKVLNIGGTNYKLSIGTFNEDEVTDIASLLKIDYSNLIGELVTFPVVVNKLGIMLADAESAVSEAKLNKEIYEAKLKEKLRVELAEANKGKSPTVEQLNNATVCDKAYQALYKKHVAAQKARDYMLTIYLSSKDKSEKLNKLSLSVQPGDVTDSMLEGKINGIVIRKSRNRVID